jgi:transposase-like protein
MAIVVLKLPDVKSKAEGRPTGCPVCKGSVFQRWGGRTRQVRDPQVREVQVYRYRCCACQHTFRHYPAGVEQAQQTQRMRKLAALCWKLGLSYRGIETVLDAFGVQLRRMSAWRDVQEWNVQLKRQRHWQPVRVLGVDGAGVRGWGDTQGVLIAVDLGTGQPVELGYVDERNPDKVRRWLEPLVKRLGVSVIVTDDLFSYRVVAEKLGLEHQVCQFHVRRWVGKTVRELRESLPADWLWVLDEVKQLLAELPLEGSRRLLALWKQIPESREAGQPVSALGQLRLLLIRLSEHWASYRVFDWQKDVPWTNNGTEQVIGRMKQRSRTVRGYKTPAGMLAGLRVAGTSLNA